MLFFYFLAVLCLNRAQKTSDIVTAMLEGEPLMEEAAGELLEQEEKQENFIQSCFWGELPDSEAVCRETGKSSRVMTVVTKGNPELVMPGTLSLQWQERGCFLDTKTAEELFGTKEAAGQQLWWKEKNYTVCGTFESLRRVLVRQADQKDNACLDMVSLKGDCGSAEQFLMRNGLTGEVAEFAQAGVLIGDLLLILPILLAAALLRFLLEALSEILSESGKTAVALWKKAGCFTAMCLVAAAALWLILRYFHIPRDMVPSKWSDFTFWSQWWDSQRQNLLRILGSAQGEMQLMLLWNLMASFLANLIAVFCGISVIKTK